MNTSKAAYFEAIKAAGPSREDSLARITLMARFLDNAFILPGLKRPVGFDVLIGLIPILGDAISAMLGSYIIWEARQLGLPRWKIARMTANLALDTAIGAIPVAGDVFDVFFRANMRNLRIVEKHLGRASPERRPFKANDGPTIIEGTAIRIDER